jgi:hypothetical protein
MYSAFFNFFRRIGACVRCMRESFVVAAISWGVCVPIAVIGVVQSVTWLVFAAMIVAAAPTALWLLHLVAFSMRAIAFAESRLAAQDLPNLGRRRAVSVFAGAFLFGLGLTAGAKAAAQTCPPGWSCEDYVCDDPAFPQLLCNYIRCETLCIPARANGCISEYATWYCPEGHDCRGDGSRDNPATCS